VSGFGRLAFGPLHRRLSCEAVQVATRAKAGERYDNFLDALGRKLAKGPKLWQEIGEELRTSEDGSLPPP
jgi:hypothetical protein